MNIARLATTAVVPDLSRIEDGDGQLQLETLVKRAVQKFDTTAEAAKAGIVAALADGVDAIRPENLIALQAQVQSYSLYVSLASTLARKGVATVESVIKGQ
jgi:predicted component of type VI protein secretion system